MDKLLKIGFSPQLIFTMGFEAATISIRQRLIDIDYQHQLLLVKKQRHNPKFFNSMPFLTNLEIPKHRIAFTQICLDVLPSAVMNGRFSKIPYKDRVCLCGEGAVENNTHDTSIRETEIKNQSVTMEFTLVGLTCSAELQTLLFGVFTLIYATALASNFLLIFTICTCKKLHTPMYFLLINLSLVNVLSISVTTPKLLQTLWTHRNTISCYGCITQLFLFVWCLGTELFLLSFMAFDRYAAVCHPLQYTVIMKKEVCVGIASGAWLAGMVSSAVYVGLLLKLSFCNSNIVNHFFCDVPPLLKLSCSDTSLNEIMAFVADVIIGVSSCGLTLTSYCFILRAIFRIRSTEGKKKAFSTCSSHLIVVSFFFSSVIYTYIRPSSDYSLDKDKFVSLLYSVVTPVVNPLIYSLRNKEVKEALKTITGRGKLLQ
ncbi:olfactory receptor 13G1-like [Rhineura floridana]|uniref:olfactory receptor 13G1-like n=1 Tax=Rhineura floridana TaxID=261503 RepID=UPI002AC86733|nr:olfactory receptor 13G1-like [Rhineura floridana]